MDPLPQGQNPVSLHDENAGPNQALDMSQTTEVNIPRSPSPQTLIDRMLPTPQAPNPAFDNICTEIVKEQSRIIGSRLALEQVQHIDGLTVEPVSLACHVTGDANRVISDIVSSFSRFFGHAAVEVCREAAARYVSKLAPADIPQVLRSKA